MKDSTNLAADKTPVASIDATRDVIKRALAQQAEQRAADRARDDAMRVARADRKKAETAARLNDRKARNQRESRARKAAAEAAALAVVPVKVPLPLDRSMLAAEAWAFRVWLREPGQRRTQLRANRMFWWTARVVLHQVRLDLGRDPGGTEFARRLSAATGKPVDRYQGAYSLKQIATLEGIDGPWWIGDRKCGDLG